MTRKKAGNNKKKVASNVVSAPAQGVLSGAGSDVLPLKVVAPAAFWNALSEDDIPAELDVDFEANPAPASAAGSIASAAILPDLLRWFAKGVAASGDDVASSTAAAAITASRLEFEASLSKEERAAVHTAIAAAGLSSALESCSEGVGEQRKVMVYKKGCAPGRPTPSPELLERAATLYKWARDSGLASFSRDEIAEQMAAAPDGAGLAPPLAALWAARSAEQSNVAALAKLVEADDAAGVTELLKSKPGLAVAVDSNTGQPPLHAAARIGAVAALRALVAAGAKLEDKDAHGHTALAVSRTFEQCDAEAALLQLGAHDPEAGRFPLNKAAAELIRNAAAAAPPPSPAAPAAASPTLAAPTPATAEALKADKPGAAEGAGLVAQMVRTIAERVAGERSAATKPAAAKSPAAAAAATPKPLAAEPMQKADTAAAEAGKEVAETAAAVAPSTATSNPVVTEAPEPAAAEPAAQPASEPTPVAAGQEDASAGSVVSQMVRAIADRIAASESVSKLAAPKLAVAPAGAPKPAAPVALPKPAVVVKVPSPAGPGPQVPSPTVPGPEVPRPVVPIVEESKPTMLAVEATKPAAPVTEVPEAGPLLPKVPKPAAPFATVDLLDIGEAAPAIKATTPAVAATAAADRDTPSAPSTPEAPTSASAAGGMSGGASPTAEPKAAAAAADGGIVLPLSDSKSPAAVIAFRRAMKVISRGQAWVVDHAGFAVYAGATALAAGATILAMKLGRRR